MAPRRPLMGGVPLSAVTFGTMRLHGLDLAAADRLLRRALEAGVTTVHCSSEYESFPLFAELWRGLGSARAGATVIAKLGVPHFGEDRFSPAKFREKIDGYLAALGAERVDVVQWLLRYDIKQPEARLRILAEARDGIAELVAALKAEGKMAALAAFPYDLPMADAVLSEPFCDGLAVYLNPLEREFESQVARAGELGKAVVAIRPYAAGRVFAETDLSASAAIAHALSFPAVATTVASVSSDAHLDALLPFAAVGEAA